MDVKEAAIKLDMSEAAVYQLCKSKRLGHRRKGPSGGIIEITPEHIAAYLESCEVPVQERSGRSPKLFVRTSRFHHEPTAAEVIAKHRGKKAVRKSAGE